MQSDGKVCIAATGKNQGTGRQRTESYEVEGNEVEYLEATLDDVELANRLASDVMGQSLDALWPQTRQLLERIDDYVSRQAQDQPKPRGLIRFTQRQLREALDWSDFQIRKHLARLVELEYVVSYRTRGARNQREYQLLYEDQGRDGQPFLLGLADVRSFNHEPAASESEAGQHGKSERFEIQNEPPQGQNEPLPSPLRAACEPLSSGQKNRVSRGVASRLHQTNSRPSRKTVKQA